MHVVAVIPARGGSKGIPLKNLVELDGRPLVAHVIQTCLAADCVDRTVVSTDDRRIAEAARQHGAEAPFLRPAELAGDEVTLDPVIYHAVTTLEAQGSDPIDVVLTVQPTAPLLRPETIEEGVRMVWEEGWDSVVSVREDSHLHWQGEASSRRPLYEERRNRQDLEPMYCETGGLFVSRREVVTPEDRLGERIGLLVLSEGEALDIDTKLDLQVAELILRDGFLASGR